MICLVCVKRLVCVWHNDWLSTYNVWRPELLRIYSLRLKCLRSHSSSSASGDRRHVQATWNALEINSHYV